MFKGIATAIITPFKNGVTDYDTFRNLIEMQIIAGIDALVVIGTTGESATSTIEEDLQAIGFAQKVAAGRITIIAGVGSNCTQTVLNVIPKVEAMGIYNQMVVTPYYNKSSQRGLISHYKAIADANQSNILLYNVPSRTGVNLDADTVVTLAKHPRIVGLKEASGNMSYFAELTAKLPKEFLLYCGNDDLNHIMMTSGAVGAISVMSNAVPKVLVKQYHTLKAGDYHSSLAIQNNLHPLIKAVFKEVNPIGIKALLAHQGKIENVLRLPLVPMSDINYNELVKVYQEGNYED